MTFSLLGTEFGREFYHRKGRDARMLSFAIGLITFAMNHPASIGHRVSHEPDWVTSNAALDKGERRMDSETRKACA